MSDLRLPITCEQFESRASDYIDGALSVSDRAIMDAHAAQCVNCATTLAELAAIVRDAASMPVLTPSRDLWSGIADRLDTPVVSIGSSSPQTANVRRAVSFRLLAAAAVLLMAVSSGATYLFTRASSTSGTQPTQVASGTAQAAATAAQSIDSVQAKNTTPSSVVASQNTGATASNFANGNGVRANADLNADFRTRSRYASNNGNSVEFVYEREITAMRRIVDERLGDLDSTTVLEIERNLRIIDKAIDDSRRALQNDPRSRFLSTQLDRALENKLDVLRRIALL